MRRTLLILAGLAALNGCAALTEAECRSADWRQIGGRDGVTGNRPFIDVYVEQCKRHGVAPAVAAYMEGWQVGYWDWIQRVHGSECCGVR